MLDHDEFCHAKPTVDPRRCAECKQLAAARADEWRRQRANLRTEVSRLPVERRSPRGVALVERVRILALLDGSSDA